MLTTGGIFVNDGRGEFKDHVRRTGVTGAGKKGKMVIPEIRSIQDSRGPGAV